MSRISPCSHSVNKINISTNTILRHPLPPLPPICQTFHTSSNPVLIQASDEAMRSGGVIVSCVMSRALEKHGSESETQIVFTVNLFQTDFKIWRENRKGGQEE